MRPKSLLAILFLAILPCLAPMAAAGEEAAVAAMPPVTLSQAIDIIDTSNHTIDPSQADFMHQDYLRMRVKQAYDAGIRKLYFRATGGVSYYPGSKLRKFYKGIRPGASTDVRTLQEYDILAESRATRNGR